MNNSSATCSVSTQHFSIIVLLCLVFFMGFLLNVFCLGVFCCRMSSWSAGTTLQFSLALSDALAAPSIPLIATYFAMGNDWPFGQVFCKVIMALLSSQFYGSTIFLTLISVHRYTAVVHFNKSSRMKNKSFIRKLCAGVWLLLLAQCLIYGFTIPTTKVQYCLTFIQRTLKDSLFIISCVLFTVGFLLPFIISAISYFRVTNALIHLNTSSSKGLKVKLKSQRMIRMCLIIFGICFLPMNVIRTIGVVLNKYYPEQCKLLHYVQTAYYVSWILAGVNCCLDPLLYFFGSENFRGALKG
ncbi:P2Y purinoceptor 2-like [Boleophthalmus pectinirostris]|uniref:P2Y purinoceptor 2-like n=1 Tax=Boleophthalmus pectinirostris TaxID=150288 RepID=UPI00242BF304|nr:P2Y purinoceptor 2-like [Boleophthalmus pectinirostris]